MASLAGRSAAAAVVAAASGSTDGVRAVAGGWLVRDPTGRQAFLTTLTALVDKVGPDSSSEPPLPLLPDQPSPAADRRRGVVVVHGSAPGAIDGEADGWPEVLMGDSAPSTEIAAPRRPEAVLASLLGPPLDRHVRVVGLRSDTLSGWGPPVGSLVGLPDTVASGQFAALLGLVALRASDRSDRRRLRNEISVGPRTLVVDVWNGAVLGVGLLGGPRAH